MAYSTYEDVKSEFKGVDFGSSTPVTSTEVTGFIVQADALIDSLVSKRYETPITGSISLSIIKLISIWLVADRVSKILQVKTTKEETKTADKSLYDKAMAMLKAIIAGDLVLTDATVVSSGNGWASYANSNSLENEFKKGEPQW